MNLREAAQLALEALEIANSSATPEYFYDATIATLRSALEAEPQDPAAIIHRNEAGQISIKTPSGDAFDISDHVGARLCIEDLAQTSAPKGQK